MISRTTEGFRRLFARLPRDVQRQARRAYALFVENPQHPSLRFKQVHPTRPIYSVRISLGYRAIGVLDGDAMVWFWIGSHQDYDGVISKL